MSKGIFGGLFDFNRDGEMNVFERAAEFAFLEDIIRDEEKEASGDDVDLDEEDVEQDLLAEGLDYDELSLMDEDERIEALEDAGLDPDDYDFD